MLGTEDPAGIVYRGGIWDHGGLGIEDQGSMGIEVQGSMGSEGQCVLYGGGLGVCDVQSRGEPDSQVASGSRVRRCRRASGGLGSRGQLAGAPQLQPRYHPQGAKQCSSRAELDELHL